LKGPCNPCLALNNPPDYSCAFSLNTGNGNEVSDIWQNLWNIYSSTSLAEREKKDSLVELPLFSTDNTGAKYVNVGVYDSHIGVVSTDRALVPNPPFLPNTPTNMGVNN